MAIAKLLLLLVTSIAHQFALTAPNVRPPTEELREQCTSEYGMSYLTVFLRAHMWALALLEGSFLFALSDHCPSAIARHFLHHLLPTSPIITSDPILTALTPTFLTGCLLSIFGALLRTHCFHTLGQRFTFELSIRPAHALVTDGVYGVVRHPSYTGGVMLVGGWLLCALDRRGWVVRVCVGWAQAFCESGDAIVTGVLACVWAAMLGIIYMVLIERMNKEDAMLEKNFGEEWRVWARRVPYRLVPGVY